MQTRAMHHAEKTLFTPRLTQTFAKRNCSIPVRPGRIIRSTTHQPYPAHSKPPFRFKMFLSQPWIAILAAIVCFFAGCKPDSKTPALEFGIGDVTPFLITDVTAKNFVHSGASISVTFSKSISSSFHERSDWIEVSPPLTNLTVEMSEAQVTLRGNFQSGRHYEVLINPRLLAAEPFKLSGSNSFSVLMPEVPARIYFPHFSTAQMATGHRQFPVLTINVPKFRIRAKLLEPKDAIHALAGYSDYFVPYDERRDDWEPFRSINYALVPGRTIYSNQFAAAGPPDIAETTNIDWDLFLGGRQAGVVFLDVERVPKTANEKLGAQAIIQLTDLGVVWKGGENSMQLFVFSNSTGRPVAGATIRFCDDEHSYVSEAITDGNGLAQLTLQPGRRWITVQKGNDFHALDLRDSLGEWRGSSSNLRVLLISDRNLYRPGEVFHFKALAREWDDQRPDHPERNCGHTSMLRSAWTTLL